MAQILSLEIIEGPAAHLKHHRRTSPKKLGVSEVLPKFCDVCPNNDFIVHYGYDKKIVRDSRTKNQSCPKIMVISKKRPSHEFSLLIFNFRSKIKVFFKKKRFSPKFGQRKRQTRPILYYKMYYAAQYILLKGPQVADHYFRKPIWETSTTVTLNSSLLG